MYIFLKLYFLSLNLLNVKLSDFEENVDVIGEVHSDCDINEIYVEKGILGKHLRGNQMARSSL